MKCSRCQHENRASADFCEACGTAVNGAAATATSDAHLMEEVEGLRRSLSESLEQQTATSEILRVISNSPTSLQPVFDAIVRSTSQLCDGLWAIAMRYDDGLLHIAAQHNPRPSEADVVARFFPRPVVRESAHGRAILDGIVVHIADATVEPGVVPEIVRAGVRAVLVVPMLREGRAVGTIGVSRGTPGPFAERQIELLKTFAAQAVIAIENVRLFNETKEALEQQTATSEILRVISSSPTDVQPTFDAIAASATRVCAAGEGTVFRFDGTLIHMAAHRGLVQNDLVRRVFPRPAGRESVTARAILTRSVVHIPDVTIDPDLEHNVLITAGFRTVLSVPMLRDGDPIGAITVSRQKGSALARQLGYRTILSVPLMREGIAIGAIVLRRTEARLFSERQIALLQTFADQAVIAIENVRLFTELQQKNQALTQAHAQVTESLEQQTATSEILNVISSSPTDVQPVFDTIAASAVRLCEGQFCHLFRFDGDLLHFVAHHGLTPERVEAVRSGYPMRPGRGSAAARSILSGSVEQIPDVHADADYRHGAIASVVTSRSNLAVPMLRDGVPIGALVVARSQAGLFPDRQIALLKTFADQAVIAIENVRLFKELEARNTELTETLARQTATGEVLRAISRAQTDAQPVFDMIARSALRLCGGGHSGVWLYDGELIHVAALDNVDPDGAEAIRRDYPRPADEGSTTGRAIRTSAVQQVPDVFEDQAYALKSEARTARFRSFLAAPMLRDGEPIGAIGVGRPEPGRFSDKQVALLQTFADQAVIAIENVRLFKELQARTADLTRSVDRLTALGEVGRAVSSTLDLDTVLQTIVSRAVQITGTEGGSIYEYDASAEEFEIRATLNVEEEIIEAQRALRPHKGEGVVGRLADTRQAVEVPDITAEGAYSSRLHATLVRAGMRSLLAVPLLRKDELVGGLVVTRRQPGSFAPEIIDLLRTFAVQSALAIQNARLFREIEEKSRELEAASQHKSEFLANMSHELRTPLNAIIGFSEVLSEGMFGDVNEKQTEYLGDILDSGRHLLSLINDILDLSKIEAGRMELEATDFDLPSAIENALILVRERAGRRGITLGCELDDRLGTIRADERKVKQVLLNLLSNALKFTPEGGRIDVRAGLHDDVAEISVADTGVGIAPEDQEAVFEEFRQVGTAAKKVEGTGLGLALSRKFIELHGGKIWVKSQVGVGSTFTLTLPVRHGE